MKWRDKMSLDFLKNSKVLDNKNDYYLIEETNQGFKHYAIYKDLKEDGFNLLSHSDSKEFMINDFILVNSLPRRLTLKSNKETNEIVAFSIDERPENTSPNRSVVYYTINKEKDMLEKKITTRYDFSNNYFDEFNDKIEKNKLINELNLYFGHIRNFSTNTSFYFRDWTIEPKFERGQNVSVSFVDRKGDYESTELLKILDRNYDKQLDCWKYTVNVDNRDIEVYENSIKKLFENILEKSFEENKSNDFDFIDR